MRRSASKHSTTISTKPVERASKNSPHMGARNSGRDYGLHTCTKHSCSFSARAPQPPASSSSNGRGGSGRRAASGPPASAIKQGCEPSMAFNTSADFRKRADSERGSPLKRALRLYTRPRQERAGTRPAEMCIDAIRANDRRSASSSCPPMETEAERARAFKALTLRGRKATRTPLRSPSGGAGSGDFRAHSCEHRGGGVPLAPTLSPLSPPPSLDGELARGMIERGMFARLRGLLAHLVPVATLIRRNNSARAGGCSRRQRTCHPDHGVVPCARPLGCCLAERHASCIASCTFVLR